MTEKPLDQFNQSSEEKMEEEYYRHIDEMREKYIEEIKGKLSDIEKLPDDVFVYFNYQYKYRPQNSEELFSAREAAGALKFWLGNEMVDINGLQVKVFSEEEAEAFKERKEREYMQSIEENEHGSVDLKPDSKNKENKETPIISVSREDLEDIALWAEMGHGSLTNINNPDGAKTMLGRIKFKVDELLEGRGED